MAFYCVFLILKAGVINSPLNSSDKRKFPRTTSHEQDQEYKFLILGPFNFHFSSAPNFIITRIGNKKNTIEQILYRLVLAVN